MVPIMNKQLISKQHDVTHLIATRTGSTSDQIRQAINQQTTLPRQQLTDRHLRNRYTKPVVQRHRFELT